jgi:hypothetical protein
MLPPAGPPWNVQAYDASTGKTYSGPDTAGQYSKDKWEGPTEDPFGFRQKARVMEQAGKDAADALHKKVITSSS